MSEEDIESLPDGAVLVAPNGDRLTMDHFFPTPTLRLGDGSAIYVYNLRLEYDPTSLRLLP